MLGTKEGRSGNSWERTVGSDTDPGCWAMRAFTDSWAGWRGQWQGALSLQVCTLDLALICWGTAVDFKLGLG